MRSDDLVVSYLMSHLIIFVARVSTPGVTSMERKNLLMLLPRIGGVRVEVGFGCIQWTH